MQSSGICKCFQNYPFYILLLGSSRFFTCKKKKNFLDLLQVQSTIIFTVFLFCLFHCKPQLCRIHRMMEKRMQKRNNEEKKKKKKKTKKTKKKTNSSTSTS